MSDNEDIFRLMEGELGFEPILPVTTKEEALVRIGEIDNDLIVTSREGFIDKFRQVTQSKGFEITISDDNKLYQFLIDCLLDEKNELKQKFDI